MTIQTREKKTGEIKVYENIDGVDYIGVYAYLIYTECGKTRAYMVDTRKWHISKQGK